MRFPNLNEALADQIDAAEKAAEVARDALATALGLSMLIDTGRPPTLDLTRALGDQQDVLDRIGEAS